MVNGEELIGTAEYLSLYLFVLMDVCVSRIKKRVLKPV
jgi:hypothetical protein